MKFKTKIKNVAGEYTRDGITIPVTRQVATSVPSLPRDWNTIGLRVAVGVSLALTAAVIVWSTVKIGSLLHGGVGYIAAGIFDIGWMMALLLAYLSRYDESKRDFADRLGWAMLIATMGALFWAGKEEGSIAMGVVGAAVSAFAKGIWVAVMQHVNADLSDDDRAWIAAQISSAQSQAAVAQVRRQTARIEQSATLELLAMERERADMRAAFGLDVQTAQVETVVPALELEAPTLADMAKTDAIRFVWSQCPESGPAEIASILDTHGVEVKTEYVKQVINRTSKTEPSNIISFAKEA